MFKDTGYDDTPVIKEPLASISSSEEAYLPAYPWNDTKIYRPAAFRLKMMGSHETNRLVPIAQMSRGKSIGFLC